MRTHTHIKFKRGDGVVAGNKGVYHWLAEMWSSFVQYLHEKYCKYTHFMNVSKTFKNL